MSDEEKEGESGKVMQYKITKGGKSLTRSGFTDIMQSLSITLQKAEPGDKIRIHVLEEADMSL